MDLGEEDNEYDIPSADETYRERFSIHRDQFARIHETSY